MELPRNKTNKILGYSASAVVQWMGRQGWNFYTTRKVCDALGASDFKNSSIRTALTDWKNEKYARNISLRPEQINQLYEAAGLETPMPLIEPAITAATTKMPTEKTSRFFNPHCQRCGEPIEENSPIVPYTSPSGKGTWVHSGCKPKDAVEKETEHKNGHAICKFTDTYQKRLEGVDSLTEMLADRIKQLEDVTEKQANKIIELQKARPPREIVLVKPDKKKIKLQQNTHPIFEQVLFHIQAGDNVMLVGPRGCGKSFLTEQIAKALSHNYGFLSLSGGVTEAKLFGRVTPDISTGKNIFHRALFAELFEEGGVFLLDEVDAADPNVLLAVNSGLANGQLALDRPRNPIAKRHEHFVCLAAANTWGNGADRQYVGRNQQDSAFTERFVQIGMDYDRDLERALCPRADELLERMWKYRNNIKTNRLERTVSTRFICRAYNWLQREKDLAYVDSLLFAGWREDEIHKAKGGC